MKTEIRHQLWLIYSQLKDAEAEGDPGRRLELLECSREELGQVLNEMNRTSLTGTADCKHQGAQKHASVC